MKKIFMYTLPAFLVLSITACGDSANTEETVSEDTATKVETIGHAGPAMKNEQLNEVYQHYVHLTTALTNSDTAEAANAARAIVTGAGNLETTASIAATAEKIASANDLEAQRKHYETLSNAMIALVKKEGLASGEIYVQYCPMAFNDKGASWLSSHKEIRNPYFGDKMMTCGEVKETIQ